MEGILSSKGDTWIEVLDDGNYLHRFIPEWIGLGPANGGRFNQSIIDLIDRLIVGNRIKVEWFFDQHLRVLDAELLRPDFQEGIFVGYLLKISSRWIDAQNIKEGKPRRFYLPWVGGYPSEGGGYDKEILKELNERKPTDPVRFSWEYKNRPILVSLFKKERDYTIPFWVGKNLPKPKIIRVEKKLKETERVSSDSEPAKMNPFDQLGTKSDNPFDQLNTTPHTQGNPFDQSQESVKPSPVKIINPFDDLPLPENNAQ